MTTELWYLFLTTVLLTVLWIPYIYGTVQAAGVLTPEQYRSGRKATLPAWVRWADRVHVNLVEQFAAFAGLVVIAHLAGLNNATTAVCAAVFFWARVAHAIVYLAGIPYARTVAFVVTFLALMVFAWQIFASMP